MTKKLAVLGAGAWGTALGCIGARAGLQTQLWCRGGDAAREISAQHKNPKYLDDAILPADLTASSDLESVVKIADVVLVATPAQHVAAIAQQIAGHVRPNVPVVSAAKGIDRETGLSPCGLLAKYLPGHPVASISGPSFAHDVVKGLPTAVTVASHDLDRAIDLCHLISSEKFRCYASDDLIGVELGGALKNVLALAVGTARGMALGASAEAALIARGFAEINRIAVSCGANPETMTGLSGLGDLVLTCSSPQSRNFAYGVALGRGDALAGLKLAEGIFTAKIAEQIALKQAVNCPIISAVSAVIDGKLSAKDAVTQLLQRPLKPEHV